jgi:ribosomal protein L11 methylase PrmA
LLVGENFEICTLSPKEKYIKKFNNYKSNKNYLIFIEEKKSFGNGHHPTTQLILESLE